MPSVPIEEREEWRRTLAQIFILDRFTNMCTGLPVVLVKQKVSKNRSTTTQFSLTICKILTRLPFPDNGTSVQAISCSVLDARDMTTFKDLSSLGKMVFVSDLCASVCEYAASPLDEKSSYITSHHYWLDHYFFAQALSSLTLATIPKQSEERDPILQITHVTVQTAIIHLQKGAIDRGKHVASMETMIQDSKEKCLQAAMNISRVVQEVSSSETTPVSTSSSITCFNYR
jgi:hypothetical protein